LPNVTSVTTIFFESLLSVLKTKVNVHIVWLVYTPERIDLTNQIHLNSTILDIHDYQNAVDVIKKEKPDLIYANGTWSFIDHAFSSAAKFCSIPAFCIVYSDIWIKKNLTENISSNITRFFQNSIPTDTEKNKKKFMKRGRFYLYKYVFLLKTKFTMKQDIIQTLFTIWKFVLLDKLDPRFANNTIEFLENESLLNQRIEMGYKKSNLIVTGNPIYDSSFQKLSNSKLSDKKNNKIRILFAPSTSYEHGFWTDKQREYAVKETIKELVKNKNEISVTVKIHPSSSILSDYELLVNSIDSSIRIFQKGDILEFLNDFDVIISFQSSTAEVYALLYGKPIVICNFFDLKGDAFLERGLAIDCKEPSSLLTLINLALVKNPATEQKRSNFIQEFMFKWDGRSAERICDKLIELSEKK
jgi:hypothetical protein